MFIENKYYLWYLSITNVDDDCAYVEKHHRIPKSLGGSNDKANIVRLSFRKHFLAHWLLTKCTVGLDKQKMCLAFACMTTNRDGVHISSWQYVMAKEARKHRAPPMLGKRHSAESKEKIRVAKLSTPTSQETRQKLSVAGKGNKSKLGQILSTATRQKMSLSRIGNQNRLGTFPTEETRRKLSESQRAAWARRKSASFSMNQLGG
jgi:hypothetical protein